MGGHNDRTKNSLQEFWTRTKRKGYLNNYCIGFHLLFRIIYVCVQDFCIQWCNKFQIQIQLLVKYVLLVIKNSIQLSFFYVDFTRIIYARDLFFFISLWIWRNFQLIMDIQLQVFLHVYLIALDIFSSIWRVVLREGQPDHWTKDSQLIVKQSREAMRLFCWITGD